MMHNMKSFMMHTRLYVCKAHFHRHILQPLWPGFSFCIYFLGGLECFEHSFAFVTHFCIFERCLYPNPECCRRKQARYQFSHPSSLLSYPSAILNSHLPILATHLSNVATHLPILATHLPILATHLPGFSCTLQAYSMKFHMLASTSPPPPRHTASLRK